MNADAARGVTERFRSMPMASSAVVAGRSAADMLFSVVSLVVLVGAGLLVGWQWNEGIGEALHAFALLLLLRFAFIWVGIYLGLVVQGQESVAMVQVLVWPFAAVGDAERHARAVRQPGLRRRLVDRPARRTDGGGLAARDRRGVLPAVGEGLPRARELGH